jgi:hypothetical protein
MPAYLCGVVPTGFTVAVMEKATELFDLELPGEAVDDARRDAREVLKEGTEENGRCRAGWQTPNGYGRRDGS